MLDTHTVAQWLQPDWGVSGVRAYCTTRAGHLSQPPFDGFNTAGHVGDDPDTVAACRQALADYFQWQGQPQWLRQVHGTTVVEAQGDGLEREGDAVISRVPGQVCTLHTADCLPVFFAACDASVVALAHAGWRGLAAGVLEATVKALAVSPRQLRVWLGPAISQPAFEVGDEVRQAFVSQDAAAQAEFQPNARGRWQADLYGLARRRLHRAGVTHISGGDYCTFYEPRFFSYRRQPRCGRLLSLIWIDPAQ
ncbi:MAG: hypothetical protein CML06_01190 [Pseudomonadales bacterium]|nr:hypothetical protein [Pseudomonadales bacterium]